MARVLPPRQPEAQPEHAAGAEDRRRGAEDRDDSVADLIEEPALAPRWRGA
jgi:hypothetical protein